MHEVRKIFWEFPNQFRSEAAAFEGDYYVIHERRSSEDRVEFEIRTQKSKVTETAKKFLGNLWDVII